MMDYEKIKAGVQLMLEGIGEDVTREGLLETPDRIARMCAEIYGGLYEDASVHLKKQFTVERNDIVVEKDITFTIIIPQGLQNAQLSLYIWNGLSMNPYQDPKVWKVM